MHTTGQSLYHGRFTLLAPIGRGGSGVVWDARDAHTGATVAIKLLAADAGGLAAVEREAEAAVRVRHPNAVQVLLTFEDADCAGVVMERCVASAADRVAAHGPVAPDDAVRMIAAVLAALTAAHAAGVVHRDIKPANILLRADGSAALSDWGIARALFGSGVTHTTSIALLGTLPYLAPELRQDPRAASPATDLYAVGITLAWLLTGKVPPDPFVPAGEAAIRAALPAGLADVVLRACAWEPAERYASAAEMAGGLAGALDAQGVREVRAVVRKATGAVRRPMWLGAVVLGLGVGWVGWGRGGEATSMAQTSAEGTADPPACADAVSDWVPEVRLGPKETTAASLADVDRDGLLDAIFTNQYDESITVWWGERKSLPKSSTNFAMGRVFGRAAIVQDSEADTVDVLVPSVDLAAIMSLSLRSRSPVAPATPLFQSPVPLALFQHDIDKNGTRDLAFLEGTCLGTRLGLVQGAYSDELCAVHTSAKSGVALEWTSELNILALEGRKLMTWTLDPNGRVTKTQTRETSYVGLIPVSAPNPNYFLAQTSGGELMRISPSEECTLWVPPATADSPLSAWQIEAAGDIDQDGITDLIGFRTCRMCTSNHTFIRGTR